MKFRSSDLPKRYCHDRPRIQICYISLHCVSASIIVIISLLMPCAQVFGYAQENKTYKRPSVNTIYKTYNRYNTNNDDDTTIIIKYLHIVIILTSRRCYRENLCHGNIYLNIVVSTGRGCEHIVIFWRRFAYW